MKAEELRIGNYVNYNGKDCVFDIYDIVNLHDDEDCANLTNPIPLTEEWLLKFGFEIYEFDHKENQYGLKGRLIVLREGYFCDYGTSVVLKSVHQLQNIYFALTNNELTL
jgi:hypothetical protein